MNLVFLLRGGKMKKLFIFLILLFIGCEGNVNKETTTSDNTEINTSTSEEFIRKMIIPLYFYDINKWDRVAENQNEIVIINPNNGPGDTIDTNYENLITKLNNNKDLPIGYIYTKWGNRDINEVKSDIDKWLSFYNVKGFFVDEAATDTANLSYYQELSDYIKSKGNYYIVLNPGVMPDESYFSIADNIVVFEDDVNKLKKDVCDLDKNKSSIIVYDANETQMKEIVNDYNCKGIYVTDDEMPNPYDTLPTYFDEEIELLK